MTDAVQLIARAIGEVQLWERFNDWTSDCVPGLPVEICRYGGEGEDEIVVVERHPVHERGGVALYEAVRLARARAALAAMQSIQEWRLIDTWDAEPHGPAHRVLIAAGNVVGEAWYRDADGANDSWESGWWWAGTGPGEYASSPVIETNDPVTHWMPLPSAPQASPDDREVDHG